MVIMGRDAKRAIADATAKYARELPAGGAPGKGDVELPRGADVPDRQAAARRASRRGRGGRPAPGRAAAIGLPSGMADARRSATAEKLAAHAGIAPSLGGGGITKTGTAWPRRALFDAAAAAVRRGGGMMGGYERTSRRRGRRMAEVAAAGTMATVIRHMPADGAECRMRGGGPARDAGGGGAGTPGRAARLTGAAARAPAFLAN